MGGQEIRDVAGGRARRDGHDLLLAVSVAGIERRRLEEGDEEPGEQNAQKKQAQREDAASPVPAPSLGRCGVRRRPHPPRRAAVEPRAPWGQNASLAGRPLAGAGGVARPPSEARPRSVIRPASAVRPVAAIERTCRVAPRAPGAGARARARPGRRGRTHPSRAAPPPGPSDCPRCPRPTRAPRSPNPVLPGVPQGRTRAGAPPRASRDRRGRPRVHCALPSAW